MLLLLITTEEFLTKFKDQMLPKKKDEINSSSFFGTPGRIRTYDLRLRKPTLYPAELQVHMILLAV